MWQEEMQLCCNLVAHATYAQYHVYAIRQILCIEVFDVQNAMHY